MYLRDHYDFTERITSYDIALNHYKIRKALVDVFCVEIIAKYYWNNKLSAKMGTVNTQI